MTYWNKTYECMGREELEQIQLARLKMTVSRVYMNVPYYREKMQKLGLTPEDIRSLDDLQKLPFTYKQDLRDHYPFGSFAAPMSEIVEVHASSGTTGKLTVVGYTAKDLDIWTEIMARSLVSAGCSKESIVQVSFGYGLFTGGFGVHYGAQRIGSTVIPISGGNTERQVNIMKDFGTTFLACTPSYALHIAEVMDEMGVSKEDIKVRSGIFGAEPWSQEMRIAIEQKLGLKAIDIYGLSEIMGPGVSVECMYQNGMHIFEDHFIPEIIDPDTQQVLPPGEKGELVFTTITKEGIPLIRYRTRDISMLNYDQCECGRTHVRMHKVFGRSDDMIIIRGVNVFPSQIESVLLEMGEVEPHYLLVINREGNRDILEVWVEMNHKLFSDEVKSIQQTSEKIRTKIQTMLGLSVKVKLVEPKTIPRSEGKAKRIQDNRPKLG